MRHGLESEHLFDDGFVSLLVACLESDLRVSDDAPGVSDVSWSPVRIVLGQLRVRSPKDRISKSESAGELASRFTIRVDRNGINEEARVCISLVESLEMHHLLAAECSVPREEADCRAVAMLTTFCVGEDNSAIVGSERNAVTAEQFSHSYGRQRISRPKTRPCRTRDTYCATFGEVSHQPTPDIQISFLVADLHVDDTTLSVHDIQWIASSPSVRPPASRTNGDGKGRTRFSHEVNCGPLIATMRNTHCGQLSSLFLAR